MLFASDLTKAIETESARNVFDNPRVMVDSKNRNHTVKFMRRIIVIIAVADGRKFVIVSCYKQYNTYTAETANTVRDWPDLVQTWRDIILNW